MTRTEAHQAAYAQLPESAKWSCSFGYPGQSGFKEYWRTDDGRKFVVSNGIYGDNWTVVEVAQ